MVTGQTQSRKALHNKTDTAVEQFDKLSFAEKVIDFNKSIAFYLSLPDTFKVLNPFIENPETIEVMELFYHKFYQDFNERKFIIGINPSRHGAGISGVPFTDTKRLESHCGIKMQSAHTHEVSSVFMYDMISEFGGTAEFFNTFYINSPFPLAIVRRNKSGNWVNANYYDTPILFKMLKNFMIETLKKHISIGLNTDEAFVLGNKNAVFIEKLNKEAKLFNKLTVLEHPRFIQQYRSKEKQWYIEKYIKSLNG
ncbi:MAG: SMUG2 DNA glycosylase family protein [Crocinitomicaceae bacterium]|nr:SMUG2 DNA glycosylase family protein [Crocinitomicaceae bacterium]